MMDFKLEEEINPFLPKLYLLMVFMTTTENQVGHSQNLDLIDLSRRADQQAPGICTWLHSQAFHGGAVDLGSALSQWSGFSSLMFVFSMWVPNLSLVVHVIGLLSSEEGIYCALRQLLGFNALQGIAVSKTVYLSS